MADAANAPQYTTPQTFQTRNRLFLWAMSGTSTGVPVKVADLPDKTVEIYAPAGGATFGGATIVFEGSNDPTADPTHANYATSQWTTLTDTTETDISTVAAKLGPVQVLQNPVWVRPKSTGGTTTSAIVALNAGRN